MLIYSSQSDEDCFGCKKPNRKPITFSVQFSLVDLTQEVVIANIGNKNTNMEIIKNGLQENEFQFIKEYNGKH